MKKQTRRQVYDGNRWRYDCQCYHRWQDVVIRCGKNSGCVGCYMGWTQNSLMESDGMEFPYYALGVDVCARETEWDGIEWMDGYISRWRRVRCWKREQQTCWPSNHARVYYAHFLVLGNAFFFVRLHVEGFKTDLVVANPMCFTCPCHADRRKHNYLNFYNNNTNITNSTHIQWQQ